MALVLQSAPATEPVTAAEAKAHLRVDTDSDDNLITALIVASRQMAEKMTGRVFITQTWDLWLDQWPQESRHGNDSWWDGVREGPITSLSQPARAIELPRAPVIDVTHLKTYDTSDTEATVSSSIYFVDSKSSPGRLSLNFGQVWPSTSLRPANGINLRFRAGYGSASDVPQAIKQAILMIVAHWYEHRELILTGTISKEIEFSAKALLQPYELVQL